jgi:hypothetical protein
VMPMIVALTAAVSSSTKRSLLAAEPVCGIHKGPVATSGARAVSAGGLDADCTYLTRNDAKSAAALSAAGEIWPRSRPCSFWLARVAHREA